MVPSGQIGAVQDEWDHVWKDHDRQRPAIAPTQPGLPQPGLTQPALTQPTAGIHPVARSRAFHRQRRNRGRAALLILAACLTLAPLPGLPKANRYPGPAEALSSLFSLAPDEAEMPPLTAAVSRLAAESSAAACWVMRLAPRMPPHATPWSQPCIEP